MTDSEKDKYFTVISYDNKYFIKPNELYMKEYGQEFINKINPYTNGAEGLLCMIELSIMTTYEKIYIERFTSYVTQWHLKTGNTVPSLYRGLGLYLLKKALNTLPINYTVIVKPAWNSKDVLVSYYNGISFEGLQDSNYEMASTVQKIINCTSKTKA